MTKAEREKLVDLFQQIHRCLSKVRDLVEELDEDPETLDLYETAIMPALADMRRVRLAMDIPYTRGGSVDV